MKLRLILTVAGLAVTSASQGAAPEGFTTICTLDESCAVETSTLVAFGQQDRFVYRTLSGNFVCNGKTFGLDLKATTEGACLVLDPSLLAQSSSSSSSGVPLEAVAGKRLQPGTYAIVSRSSGKALAVDGGSTDDGAVLVQQNFTESPHQLWQIDDLGNGYYSIKAMHSGKTLETQDLSTRDGAKLQQLPWMNSWDQHWIIQPLNGGFFRIGSRYSNQTLDVYEMNQRDNGPVCLWTFWGGDNQQWRLIEIAPNRTKSEHP